MKIIARDYPADRKDLEIASLMAVIAGNAAIRYFGRVAPAGATGARGPLVETEFKSGPADLVSEADRAAEAAAIEMLREHRPDDGYVGEEGSRSAGDASNGRRWLIDGIDGTFNFLHGVPNWCTAVCLVDEHGPAVSAIWDPMAEELTVAGRGLGASCSNRWVPVDQGLERLSLVTYLNPDSVRDPTLFAAFGRVMRACATVRIMGSGSLDLVQVAEGRAGVWVQHEVDDWDWWPGALIVTEAGGVAERLSIDGHEWSVAGQPEAVAAVLSALTG